MVYIVYMINPRYLSSLSMVALCLENDKTLLLYGKGICSVDKSYMGMHLWVCMKTVPLLIRYL